MALAALAAGAVHLGGLFLQKRWADNAHQREVRDLQKAGLNPLLTGGGQGAPVPQAQEAFGDAVSSAMQARMLSAELRVREAQAERDESAAYEARTRANLNLMEANAGFFDKKVAERQLAELSVAERRQMLPLVLERARAEIERSVSSARASRARALLDELARTGAANVEQFEREIGEVGPMTRFLLELVRSLRR